MNTLTEPSRRIPVLGQKDVVVSGGGLSGVMAAVAAARAGASVLLSERHGFLGGPAAMWLPINGYVDRDGCQVVRGLGQEFIDRLREVGGAGPDFVPDAVLNPFLTIDPEAVKVVCLRWLAEAGVELHLHEWVVGVHREDERLRAVIVENKSGRQAIAGKAFVDTTGDGDIAAWAGAPFTVGRGPEERPQAVTLTMRVDGVDREALRRRLVEFPERYDLYMPHEQYRTNLQYSVVGLKKLVAQARADGYPELPVDHASFCCLLEPGAMLINMTKVKQIKAHQANDLTRAEVETRLQAPLILEFLRRYVPGFEHARLTATGGQLGIRETRHIEGDYTLTEEDVKSGRRFWDEVAIGCYPIDIHSPDNTQVNLTSVPAYGIPYRCLTPKKTENLLVAGRCLSATHEALASARVMATCMAMGQAAGEAAAWVAREECSTRQVDVAGLKQRLRANGAYLPEN